MNYNQIFDNNKINEKNLLTYGFEQKNDKYIFKKLLKGKDFYIIISIAEKNFEVNIFDASNNEEYLPFNIKTSVGSFVANLREEVDSIVKDITENCFTNENVKIKVLDYVKEKYNTDPIFPWAEYPSFCSLNNPKGKWYGLIMNIPYKSLHSNKNGNADVINVKLDSEKIKGLVDNINIFPAYHMNKKYWLTILLTPNIPFNQITELIDESYNLVTKK
ncbi:MAG: MmcQ/YjbR family DNA-binding protein [Clostridiaceae bacterium]|jgi:predicted DNA-binding protein (MmcQ/YjbR family)|nr:MmcQ/YjbR family DNA-binding protein [Clostridiaceae bacterium]